MRPRGATRTPTLALVMIGTAMATVMAMSIAGAASANDSGGPAPRAGPMSDADASGARPTGRERPRRWLDHVVTLRGGGRMKAHVKGTVMYFDTVPVADEKPTEKLAKKQDRKPAARTETKPKPVRRRLIIRQYDRGDWGDTLEALVYVKRIELGEPDGAPKRTGAE